ncbi:MAG: prepilin-type N-terminal cleavage/methylation domain-containing protein [Gemmataceae bacterium]
MCQRQGVTLVEVLAAIGIMGIGMLAILVLFPLGAMSMARALKDDRAGTIAWNADSLCTALDYRNDPQVLPRLGGNYTPPSPLGGPVAPGPSDPLGAGYPVFIDPHYNLAGAIPATTLGPSPNPDPKNFLAYPNIPRVTPQRLLSLANPVAILQARERLFCFNDDMGFSVNGYPKEHSDGRYTWAYLVRRLQSALPSSTEVTVIVYSGRPIELPQAEDVYAVVPEDTTAVRLSWVPGQEEPPLRNGHWLLDTTPSVRPRAGVNYGTVNAQFYRVMDVSRVNANTLRVEVQPPLRATNVSQMMLLKGAIEVFERGAAR